MITIYKTEKINIKPDDYFISAEIRGLSTDEKPTIVNGKKIDNGSIFIEIDTGKLFFFDLENEQWKEI